MGPTIGGGPPGQLVATGLVRHDGLVTTAADGLSGDEPAGFAMVVS